MAKLGNQNSTTYKKDLVVSLIQKMPNASTMALARILFNENPLDFDSVEQARGNIRRYRGESNNSSTVT